MLRLRILTAVILAGALLAGLFLLEPRWALLAFGAVWTAGAWEWAGFGGLTLPAHRLAYCSLIALLLVLCWRWSEAPPHLRALLLVGCAWWVSAFVWLVAAPVWHRPRLALSCGALVLVPAFIALGRLLVSTGPVPGPVLVLWLVLLVIASDIGAFFVGRSLGRRKLAPRVSPGKTWEGAFGGLAAVALVSLAAAAIFAVPAAVAVGFGCAVGIFSVVGDLTESMFKRSAGLKDSGSVLPGHGGILDRIDSVTAAAPLYALGLFGSGLLA